MSQRRQNGYVRKNGDPNEDPFTTYERLRNEGKSVSLVSINGETSVIVDPGRNGRHGKKITWSPEGSTNRGRS